MPTTIRFIVRGTVHEVPYEPGDTILDTALRNGVNAPYSCMEGICATCEARIEEGKVDDRAEDGKVLTCQTKPLPETTLLVVNYDKV